MRILLTNDDGIRAPGIVAMHRRLTELGEVVVIAPETAQSATGHGITITTPLLTQRVRIEGTHAGEGFEGTAVDGRPADCVKVALSHLLPWRPDLVVSGINAGSNVGINVVYSGTVAAAIEAAYLGVPAVAASLYLRREVETDFAAAADVTLGVIRDLLAKSHVRPRRVISINLPAGPPKGVRIVRQCTRRVDDRYDRRTDPRGNDYFWNSATFTLGGEGSDADTDTDVAAVREGYVAVTPLRFDLTDPGALAQMTA